jgi:putative MATE family efflux protein
MARSLSARAGSIQMTEGSLYKNILLFSVPLIFSQLLQVLFNMADVAVVGKFSSATALGSVGSTSTLVTLFTGFLIGLSNGVNVRVAQYLGARQEEDTRNCVHTALILCTLSGVVIAVLCFFLAAPMLELLKTKDDLLPGAVLYFRIYALGMPALGIFNFGNAVLSASGDTKRPLAYLTAAGILNVILNLFFVIVCKMAADGVALASIISQYLSAVLVLLHMTHLTDSCRVEWKLLRLHGGEAGRILGLGIPAGIQHMIFAVANLFIQVGINSFDSTIVSGNSAAVNVDNVIYNVMAAFYTACSTFMGQNWGAGKKDRMMKSYYISLGYSFVIAAVLGVNKSTVSRSLHRALRRLERCLRYSF